ncbi:MAG TPA: hypothetical protein PLB35_09240 [Myxococcota bacterium]|nr:hypothetical protein [Myxococcota bacterium]HOH77426.1 hypothetical protein [Myxococcota bacterium]
MQAMRSPADTMPIMPYTRAMNDAASQVSVERRAKKHVKAPVHRWFAVCSPGTEAIVRAELATLGLEPAAVDIHGGVEFPGRLDDGMRANLHLRTAARILLRVASFRARAVEDVFRETVAQPWEAFLPQGCRLQIASTIHGSRLNSRSLLESTIREAVCRRFADQGLAVPLPESAVAADTTRNTKTDAAALTAAGAQAIQARLDSDHIELSLDSSGELLHRRGWRREAVAAPIRENLAAAILLAAGFAPGMNLVDAMCGSGTFAIEAAHIATGTPPGISATPPRTFAFMEWPAFSRPAWDHLCKLAGPVPTDSEIVARDIDPAVLQAASTNADLAGATTLIIFEPADFFDSAPPCPSGLLVLNPPYGLRLDATRDAAALYRRIATTISSRWAGWRYAVVMPDQSLARTWPLQTDSSLRFLHGGLKALALIGKGPA